MIKVSSFWKKAWYWTIAESNKENAIIIIIIIIIMFGERI